jgi:hypothetical protein
MQNRLLILLIALLVSVAARAQTCPPINEINIANPPVGWKLLLPPQIEGQTYHFGKAIHSLNGSFFYGQVICEYETCNSFDCPAIELLSDATYAKPYSIGGNWTQRANIAETIMCAPANHDPALCVFE